LGISLRSATEPIDDTSTGKLMDGVLAAFAQFNNDVRSERTLASMKAALSLGRWTFQAPLGYLNAPKWSTSSLVHDPVRGPLVKQAFEELASGSSPRRKRFDVPPTPACGPSVTGTSRRRPSATCSATRSTSGQVESPDCGVSARGDFEPLIDEATFYRAGRARRPRAGGCATSAEPSGLPAARLRTLRNLRTTAHRQLVEGAERPLRVLPLPRRCRAVNVSKAVLEGAFIDELALLQPTPGYMRLVKDRVLYVWEQECAAARNRTAEQERRLKAVRLKLDRLDEAFLYSESIDVETYGRQRDKLREELTFSKIDYHTDAVEELDVQGILAFAERILPRASDLWVQASLDYRQRLQELFFPEGIAYDGLRFNRTTVTAPLFQVLGAR
jgi:site-specific DNA recombinase